MLNYHITVRYYSIKNEKNYDNISKDMNIMTLETIEFNIKQYCGEPYSFDTAKKLVLYTMKHVKLPYGCCFVYK